MNRKARTSLILLILTLLFSGCGKTAQNEPTVTVPTAAIPTERAADPELFPELPLSLQQIAESGDPVEQCLVDESDPDGLNCGPDQFSAFSDTETDGSEDVMDPNAMEEALMGYVMNDLEGNEVLLSDLILKNQVTMLNVWGISCGPCLMEMPELNLLREQYRDQGFEIIGLTADLLDRSGETDPELVRETREIIDDLGITYPILTMTLDIRQQMQIIGTPTTFFVNSSGQVISERIMGTRSAAEWDLLIQNALDTAGRL